MFVVEKEAVVSMGWVSISGLVDADLVQEADERVRLALGERPEGLPVELVHHLVEPSQLARATRRDATHDLATVLVRAHALDQLLRLQAVDQARDARGVLDHALDDGERRQSARPGAP